MNTKMSYCAGIFKAIGEPTRIKIIEQLERGEMAVVDIWEKIEKEQSSTSHHLAIMFMNGIVESRRNGHRTLYSLKYKDQTLALVNSAKSIWSANYTETLKVLGHLNRMKIVESLLDGEIYLTDLTRKVGGEKTNTAHHLAKMLDAGILETRLDASRRALYKLANHDFVHALVESAAKILAQESIQRQVIFH
jgi:ArsR family transcriptional regulator